MEQRAPDILTVGLLGAVMIVIAGCAQPPTEQLEAAGKAVEAAKAAGATEYAKQDFAKLEQQFAVAKEELAKQEESLSIFRSYTDADKLLREVAANGQQVEVLAVQNKDAAKQTAVTMEREAQQVVDSARALMANAPTAKERAAVESIKQDLAELIASLEAVRQLIDKGDYLPAESQAKAVKEKGSTLAGEIQDAIVKLKDRKPKAHA